jgi:hypothetical protein
MPLHESASKPNLNGLPGPTGALGEGAQTPAGWVLDLDKNAATAVKREFDQTLH